MGGLLEQGIATDLGIVSDDAGQFNIFDHALCWIHMERLIHRLIPFNDKQKEAVDWARAGSRYFCESMFWASQPKQAAKT